ncbi:hypothetical protein SOVF_123720 [Spinacia oleracea]|nr:hypothetical protein SOVF_123720 [Spinacia oleracea]
MAAMSRAIYEGADYLLDMELTNSNKKRRRREASSFENGKVDEDYASFLEGLQEFWDEKFVEEGDDDPTYMEFLKNLEERNNAYMCNVSTENGVLIPICYEEEEDFRHLPCENKRKTPKSRSGTCIPDKKNLYQDENLKSTRKRSGAENDSSDVLQRSLNVANDLKSGLKKFSSKCGHHDGNKKKTPQSPMGGSVKSGLKNSGSKIGHHDGNKKKTPQSPMGGRVGDNRSVYIDVDQEISDSGNDHLDRIKRKTPQSYNGDHVRKNRSLDVGSDQRSGPTYSGFHKKTSVVIDETYEKFLKSLHVSEKSVFYEYDQDRIFYEPCDQQTTDVETEPLEKDMRPPPSTLRPSTPIPGPHTPFSRPKTTTQIKPTTTPFSRPKTTTQIKPTTKDDHITLSVPNKTCKNSEKSRRKSSSFWIDEGLHDYLRKPFTQQELKNLWEQLSTRKPVKIHRESRSGGTDKLGHLGKSYLDLYPG